MPVKLAAIDIDCPCGRRYQINTVAQPMLPGSKAVDTDTRCDAPRPNGLPGAGTRCWLTRNHDGLCSWAKVTTTANSATTNPDTGK